MIWITSSVMAPRRINQFNRGITWVPYWSSRNLDADDECTDLLYQAGYLDELETVQTSPADVLIAGWDRDKPAAFDGTVTSPLCPAMLSESC